MPAYSTPRVVLVGKQRNHQDYNDICDIISDIRPSQIPREFVHKVLVTTQNNKRHELNNKQLRNGVDYENIERYLTDLGIRLPDVKLVEIVIDLEKTQNALLQDTAILNNILKEVYFNQPLARAG